MALVHRSMEQRVRGTICWDVNKRFVTIVVDILSIWKIFSMNMLFPKVAINEHEKSEQEILS
jgi:hypothetical protein